MNTVIRSAGFVVFSYSKKQVHFLLLHYVNGHWDFPKGKVEPAESLQEAATRELFEETHLKPAKLFDFKKNFEYSFTDHNGLWQKKEVTLFLTLIDNTDVTLSNEHIDYKWLTIQDALHMLTYETARKALLAAYNYLQNDPLFLEKRVS